MRVEGLETLDYFDHLLQGERCTEQADAITFDGEVMLLISPSFSLLYVPAFRFLTSLGPCCITLATDYFLSFVMQKLTKGAFEFKSYVMLHHESFFWN